MFRVIWQYNADVLGPLDSEALRPAPLESITSVSVFADLSTIGSPEPVFPRPPIALRAELRAMPAEFQEDPSNDLAGYYHAFVATREAADTLRERLLGETDVTYAEIQGELQPPFILDESRRAKAVHARLESLSLRPAATQDFVSHQIYLNAAPGKGRSRGNDQIS